jgi:predicted RNase H-like HicB family nuclease
VKACRVKTSRVFPKSSILKKDQISATSAQQRKSYPAAVLSSLQTLRRIKSVCWNWTFSKLLIPLLLIICYILSMETHFTLAYWIDENWYIGRIKEVPGVFSQAESLEELEINIVDAYKMVLQENTSFDIPQSSITKELVVQL